MAYHPCDRIPTHHQLPLPLPGDIISLRREPSRLVRVQPGQPPLPLRLRVPFASLTLCPIDLSLCLELIYSSCCHLVGLRPCCPCTAGARSVAVSDNLRQEHPPKESWLQDGALQARADDTDRLATYECSIQSQHRNDSSQTQGTIHHLCVIAAGLAAPFGSNTLVEQHGSCWCSVDAQVLQLETARGTATSGAGQPCARGHVSRTARDANSSAGSPDDRVDHHGRDGDATLDVQHACWQQAAK